MVLFFQYQYGDRTGKVIFGIKALAPKQKMILSWETIIASKTVVTCILTLFLVKLLRLVFIESRVNNCVPVDVELLQG